MKKIRFLFMVLLIPFLGMAQTPTGTTTGHTQYKGKVGADSGIVNTLTDTFSRTQPIGTERIIKADSNKYVWLGNYWKKLTGNASGGSSYTFTSPLSNSAGTISIDLSNYATTAALTSGLATKQNTLGYTAESTSNKTIDANGTSNSLYPTQGAVKSYVDGLSATAVKYSDTAGIVAGYLREADTAGMLTSYARKSLVNDTSAAIRAAIPNISGKVNYTDTTSMLSPYYRAATATAALATKVNYADTAAMLSPYLRSALGVKYTDTAAMLGGYLRDADTAAMLAPYYDVRDTGRAPTNLATAGTLKKVSDSLAALIGGGGVAVASIAEVNTGTDNAKFLSPLAIQGSKYLDQSGAKVYATTAGVANTYTLTLTPAISAYTTGLSLWVKFHAANTGASTINVSGLGAKTLVKDAATALVSGDIPINQWYQLVYDGTNFLIQDIGFGGVNLSARLSGALSDETGTGVAVFANTPTLITPVLGVATATSINKVAFTAPATAATLTLANGSTLATAGAFSTTLTATATTNITLPTTGTVATLAGTETLTNKTLTSPSIATPLITGVSSGTINDSLLVADPTTGAVKRISSARLPSGGGGGISGLTTNYIPVATSSTAIGNSVMAQNGTNIGVGTTAASAYLEGVGNGNSIAGGYSNCVSAVSGSFPAMSLKETGSGSGFGWVWAMASDRKMRFIPLVDPKAENIIFGSDGIGRGMEINNADNFTTLYLKNTLVSKGWRQFVSGSASFPNAPIGSLTYYNDNVGYVMSLTGAGRAIISPNGALNDDATNRLQVEGSIKATQYRLSDLNTAPSSATDTGVKGEIRVTAGFIYICTATNTWVRTALSTF